MNQQAAESQRSFAQRSVYAALRVFFRLLFVVLYRVRVEGRQHIPPSGAALVCANHQSHLDPIIVGLAFDRRLNFLARKSLFTNPAFGWLIRFLDAIPLDRDGFSLAGIKETLKRLRKEELVLIFPEGTRTPDGAMAAVKPGVGALARRGGVAVLPVGFDGAYEIWPRRRRLPLPLGVIEIVVGEPIDPAMVGALSEEQLLAELERRLTACVARAKEKRQHRLGRTRPKAP